MKKFFVAICIVIMITACSICLTACHEHAFSKEVVSEKYLCANATCTQKATYYYSCECGEQGTKTFESGEVLGHDPSSTWTIEDEKHYKTCKREGCEHKIEEANHDLSHGDCVCGKENIYYVSASEWVSALSEPALDNVTTSFIYTSDATTLQETIYYDGGKEKITVQGMDDVALYSVNNVWYSYVLSTQTKSVVDPMSGLYNFTTITSSISTLFTSVQTAYTYFTYDGENNEYGWAISEAGMQISYIIKFENGKVVKFVSDTTISGSRSVTEMYFSNYGSTVVTIPFDV